MKFSKFLLMVLILGVLVCIWYGIWAKKTAEADKLLKNHIKFSGTVLAFDRSDNHGFGVVKMQVKTSNTKVFNNINSKYGLFPYRIAYDYAVLLVNK